LSALIRTLPLPPVMAVMRGGSPVHSFGWWLAMWRRAVRREAKSLRPGGKLTLAARREYSAKSFAIIRSGVVREEQPLPNNRGMRQTGGAWSDLRGRFTMSVELSM
jgi:hypothetical protein